MDIEGSEKNKVNNKGNNNRVDGDSDDYNESTDDNKILNLQKAKTQKALNIVSMTPKKLFIE